jgi:hypothetical protein
MRRSRDERNDLGDVLEPAVAIRMTARTLRACFAIVLVALVVPADAGAKTQSFELSAGEAVFWNGPHTDSGGNWSYEVVVTEPGYRLRIGIDHPEVGDVYDVEITSPEGGTSQISPEAGLYSAEFLRGDPELGTWKIRVTATDVTDSAFRMRAKLEARAPSLGTKTGPVLPNLQILPPHEASFLFPATNGSTDGEPTGIDTLGAEGCHPEEHVEDQAIRCLRFAFGVRNTGLGPMQLFYEGGPPAEHELFQRVVRADDSYFDRPAGTAVFHKTHGHYHHSAAAGLQLFKVTDRDKGRLEPAGAERTKGFAHREELIRDWDVFYPTWDRFGFGLGAGWADIYEWDRPGNYIDFGINTDGYYVIRMSADPVGGILESNEKDNFGYTYIKVTGSQVKMLEAGRGKDPWDPCKIEVGFGGHPDPKSGPRPKSCPPDTT